MDALTLMMRQTHHDPVRTSTFDAEAYHELMPYLINASMN
jgi:hypothetical protein